MALHAFIIFFFSFYLHISQTLWLKVENSKIRKQKHIYKISTNSYIPFYLKCRDTHFQHYAAGFEEKKRCVILWRSCFLLEPTQWHYWDRNLFTGKAGTSCSAIQVKGGGGLSRRVRGRGLQNGENSWAKLRTYWITAWCVQWTLEIFTA